MALPTLMEFKGEDEDDEEDKDEDDSDFEQMLQKCVESGHIKLQTGNFTDFKWVENSKLPLLLACLESAYE